MSDLIPKVFLKLLVGVERELNFGEHRLASLSMIDHMHDCTVHRYAGRISHMISPVGVINRLRTISPSSSQAYDRLGSNPTATLVELALLSQRFTGYQTPLPFVACARGSSALNRGYDAHHRAIRRCNAREGRPRRLGGVQHGGGT